MSEEQPGLTASQRMTISDLLQDNLRYIDVPDMPESDSSHVEWCIRFNQRTFGPLGPTEEDISVWVPMTDLRPNKNPPVLRRLIEYRGRDIERHRRHEAIAFPDVAVSHYLMTVEQLNELHALVRGFEIALSQSPIEGLGIPTEWWYGPPGPEFIEHTPPAPGKPTRSRTVYLLSDPIRETHFLQLCRESC